MLSLILCSENHPTSEDTESHATSLTVPEPFLAMCIYPSEASAMRYGNNKIVYNHFIIRYFFLSDIETVDTNSIVPQNSSPTQTHSDSPTTTSQTHSDSTPQTPTQTQPTLR